MGVFQHAEKRFGVDLMDLGQLSPVVVDLKYNGKENFMHEDLYQGFNKAYLHAHAFHKFMKACEVLQQIQPGWKFLILDALRPRHVQQKMYNFVRGTPYENYVANPNPGSMHNFGMALDLTLLDDSGKEVDMGTTFDDFTELAQPQLEIQLLKDQRLTRTQVDNRWILRSTMELAGFIQLPHEWWHYNALERDRVLGQYPIVE